MPAIDISVFKGMVPKLASRLLPNENAAYCRNCLFNAGDLEPILNATPVAATLTPGVVDAIYLYARTHWFSWADNVSVIESPVAQDQYERIYFTGSIGARVTSNLIATGSGVMPAASYDLGVPVPVTAPVAVQSNPGSGEAGATHDDEDRAYVVTYVTAYGEEGPPSPVSNIVTVESPDATVTLSGLPVPGSNNNNLQVKRIYRSATGGSGTDFYFVANVSLALTTFVDVTPTENLGKQLDTWDYIEPPALMQGITQMANGITAGFKGNEVVFSEAYLPYAYPAGYRRTTQHAIVAMAATQNSLVVATEGYPYVFSGVSPDSISEQKLEIMQACVSARSMVDMGSVVLYASPDGLVAVSDSGAKLITDAIFDRRTWQGYQPETLHAYRHEDSYIAFYGDTSGNGAGVGGFMFNPATLDFVLIDTYATAGYHDLLSDTLYLVVGGQIQAWISASTQQDYTWRSKEFSLPFVAFSTCRIQCNDPSQLTMKLWVDGLLSLTLSPAPSSEVFRLPPLAGLKWQIELSGSATIERIVLATSMSEV